MILHENKDAFKALISSISERTDIREDIIEKDYYLTDVAVRTCCETGFPSCLFQRRNSFIQSYRKNDKIFRGH